MGCILMWIFVSLILIVCLIAVLIKAKNVLSEALSERRKKSYVQFLMQNSVTLNNLLETNKKYDFKNIKSFNESHIYDNEKFYDNVSCEDYLIYQLQYKKYDIEKEIKYVKYNKEKYDLYCDEIAKIEEFGKYIITDTKLELDENYLLALEKELFDQLRLSPITIFSISVVLYCSKINGVIYDSKQQNFSAEEITSLIKRLNNKNRNFYNDKKIWESICRVERGKVSNKMRFAIYNRDGYRCCRCGKGGLDNDLEIDHIIPIAKGGKSTYDNLQTLCRKCNKDKGDTYFK